MSTSLPVLNKPKFREPCNGCGQCCREELCDIAEQHFAGAQAPCPALEWEDGRAWCGLIRHPSRHLTLKFNIDEYLSPMFLKVVPGVGQGCGMEDD